MLSFHLQVILQGKLPIIGLQNESLLKYGLNDLHELGNDKGIQWLPV